RNRGRQVVFVRHDSADPQSSLFPGSPGNALKPGFEPAWDDWVIAKRVNSAFIGTPLQSRLLTAGIHGLTIAGLTTDQCVSTTAGSAPATPTNAQSMRPGDDFYSYANASWLSSVSLPAGEQSFGPTAMLKALNSERVGMLIEEAAVPSKRKADPTARKLQQIVG